MQKLLYVRRKKKKILIPLTVVYLTSPSAKFVKNITTMSGKRACITDRNVRWGADSFGQPATWQIFVFSVLDLMLLDVQRMQHQLYCCCISHWLYFSMYLVCVSVTHADNRSSVSQVLHKHTHALTNSLTLSLTHTDTDAESQNHWQLLKLKWAASACSVKALLIESILKYAPFI